MADLTSADLAGLRASGQTVEVAFQIGKAGLTDGVVKELQARLAKEPLVKVRMLKSAREDEDVATMARELAARARVVLVETRGHTALFYRKPRHLRGPDDY